MEPFEFVLILVLIISVTRAGVAILSPLAGKFAELIGEAAADRRAQRKGLMDAGEGVDEETLQNLERRLARVEDRLDFVEELRRPVERPGLPQEGSS